jgi:hypothetical protein
LNVDEFARGVEGSLEITDRDVGATLLAIVWMEKYAGETEGGREETLDMKEKAEAWIQRTVGLGDGDEKVERLRMLKESIARMVGMTK